MGWSATITTSEEIVIKDIEDIIKEIPEGLRSGFLKQDIVPFNGWGWSAATDIQYPKGHQLMISGSYGISGNKAEKMANFLSEELNKKGYSTTIKFDW